MTEFYFELTFKAHQQRTYTKQFFTVPENTGRIEIEYDYPRFTEKAGEGGGTEIVEANIADLGLYDPDGRLRGWSGSNKKMIFTAETSASAGYRSGPIKKGEWAAALGLYKIFDELKIRLFIRLFPRERKLLKGDIHMHTINSDGVYTTAEVIGFCKKQGLDFIALTDHNNTIQNSEIGNPEGITVIPGMEYTNYRGHANFYFPKRLDDFNPDVLSNSVGEVKAVFAEAKAAGALISLNHIDCDNCPWEFGFDDIPFDMVEVWNGPMKASEMRAIDRWHGWLCSGKKIAAVGGSDTHRHELSRTYGSPSTFVYAEGNSTDSILKALARGNSFISIAPAGPLLHLGIGNKIFGETAAWEPGLEGALEIKGAEPGDMVRLIDGKGRVTDMQVPFRGIFRSRFNAEKAGFYRLELYREILGHTMLISLGNPVYIG